MSEERRSVEDPERAGSAVVVVVPPADGGMEPCLYRHRSDGTQAPANHDRAIDVVREAEESGDYPGRGVRELSFQFSVVSFQSNSGDRNGSPRTVRSSPELRLAGCSSTEGSRCALEVTNAPKLITEN